jgi:hypothetical protein
LEHRANELAAESAGLGDDDEAFERESKLVTTSGVIQAKLSRTRGKLAEAALSTQTQSVRSVFGTLYQNLRLYRVEIEKRKLLEQMVSGCPQLSIDQVTLHAGTRRM